MDEVQTDAFAGPVSRRGAGELKFSNFESVAAVKLRAANSLLVVVETSPCYSRVRRIREDTGGHDGGRNWVREDTGGTARIRRDTLVRRFGTVRPRVQIPGPLPTN